MRRLRLVPPLPLLLVGLWGVGLAVLAYPCPPFGWEAHPDALGIALFVWVAAPSAFLVLLGARAVRSAHGAAAAAAMALLAAAYVVWFFGLRHHTGHLLPWAIGLVLAGLCGVVVAVLLHFRQPGRRDAVT